jgi:hypothetical protein
MKRPSRVVRLDFVAPVHAAPLAGAALCAVGLAVALALGLAFERQVAERRRLEAELASMAPPRRSPPTPESLRSAREAAAVGRDLDVPWSRLLADLEDATQDSQASVSLLRVEPDPAKQLVRITAEVRTLGDALTYLERLQKCPTLRHPMLESHERRKDDPDHPLRIKVSAEWRT